MIRKIPATILLLLLPTLACFAQTPTLEVTPAPITFGCTLAGEDSAHTIVVRNTGAVAVTVTEYVATAPFVAPTSRDVTIAAGASVSEVVRFQPLAAPGNPSGMLTIRTPDGDLDVPMVGEAGAEPSIMPSMTSIDFFDVTVGSSKEICFVVRNPSCRPLNVVAASIDNAVFTITTGPAAPFVLGPFAEVQFCVTFMPTSQGDQSGRLTFDGELGKRASVRIAGRGVRAEIAAVPSLVNFGSIDVGAASPEVVFDVVNRGSEAATINAGLAVSGANAGDFTLATAPLPIVLGPGESMPLRVRFLPSALGPRSARIVIGNSSDVDPVVELRGTGSQFDVVVTPTEIDMGDVWVGSSRTAFDTVVVDNQSTRTVTIASTTIQGADPSVFAVLGFVVVPIASGTDYKLDIAFAPDAPRVFTAELVGTLDNGSTFRVLLRGRGLDTSAMRPRHIAGDTVSARVGELGTMRFTIAPALSAIESVTRMFLRLRIDPKAVYPHRALAQQGVTATRSYTADGIVDITLSATSESLQIGGFDLELEGLFTGLARNVVSIDSVWFDNPRIGATSSPGLVALEGCDIDADDILLRRVAIMSLAPNPSTGASLLTYRSAVPAVLRVTAMDGRQIFVRPLDRTDAAGSTIDLSLEDVADGSVVVEVTANGSSDSRILKVLR